MALNTQDPNDKVFRPVRYTGLFFFIFVYSRSFAASPVCTSTSSRAGYLGLGQRRRVTTPQRRRQRVDIISAYQRSRRRKIRTQQEAVATVACPRTGGNNDGETPCRSKDKSDSSIVTCQRSCRWSTVAPQKLAVMAASPRFSLGASDRLLYPGQQRAL